MPNGQHGRSCRGRTSSVMGILQVGFQLPLAPGPGQGTVNASNGFPANQPEACKLVWLAASGFGRFFTRRSAAIAPLLESLAAPQ